MKKAIAIIAKEVSDEVLDYYNSLSKVKSFYLITPEKNNELEKRFSKLKIFKDSEILNRELHTYIEKTSRPNWYYQQFLKYELVFFLDYDYVHIIDGDSYIREELVLEDKLFFTKKKIEKKYNLFINNINLFNNISEKSFITNQMCFSKKDLECLVQSISPIRENWIKTVVDMLIKSENTWFSEYQLYANYILNKTGENKTEKLKVYRRLDLLNVSIESALEKYPIVSYELGHKVDFLRKIRAKIYYFLQINFG